MVPSPPEVGRWQGCKTGTAPAKSSGAAVQVSARRDPQQTVGRHCQDSHHKRNGADRQIRGGPGPPAHGDSRARPDRQRRQRVSADCLCVSSTLERVAETRCSCCRGAAACSCVLANLEWTARANRAKPRGTGPGAASATLNGKTRTAQNDLRSARRKPVHRPDNQLSCDSTGLRITKKNKKTEPF